VDSLPILVRDGIRLREVDLSDAAALTTLFQRREVSQYLDPPPSTVADFSTWITHIRTRRAQNRAVSFTLLTGDDEVSGLFTAMRLENGERAEIGFAIAQHLWGTGTFQSAIDLYFEFLFTQWGVKTLIGKTQKTNMRAIGAMRKLGARVIDESMRLGNPEFVWAIDSPRPD